MRGPQSHLRSLGTALALAVALFSIHQQTAGAADETASNGQPVPMQPTPGTTTTPVPQPVCSGGMLISNDDGSVTCSQTLVPPTTPKPDVSPTGDPLHRRRAAPPPPPEDLVLAITDSVYGFTLGNERNETKGYGRYTYVLLTGTDAQEQPRNDALIRAIVSTTSAAGSSTIDKRNLNLFEFYERPDFFAKPAAQRSDPNLILGDYDFDAARSTLARICSFGLAQHVCNGLRRGPLIVTYDKPLDLVTRPTPPILVVDLSGFNERGFLHVVDVVKEDLRSPQIGLNPVNWTFAHIVSTTLDVSDWLPGALQDLKSVVEISSSH